MVMESEDESSKTLSDERDQILCGTDQNKHPVTGDEQEQDCKARVVTERAR